MRDTAVHHAAVPAVSRRRSQPADDREQEREDGTGTPQTSKAWTLTAGSDGQGWHRFGSPDGPLFVKHRRPRALQLGRLNPVGDMCGRTFSGDVEGGAGEPVDVQIMEANNNTGTPMANTILALTAQANKIADVATQLDISDPVLDPDGTACDTTNPTSTCD